MICLFQNTYELLIYELNQWFPACGTPPPQRGCKTVARGHAAVSKILFSNTNQKSRIGVKKNESAVYVIHTFWLRVKDDFTYFDRQSFRNFIAIFNILPM